MNKITENYLKVECFVYVTSSHSDRVTKAQDIKAFIGSKMLVK